MELLNDREINELEEYLLDFFQLIQAYPWVFAGVVLLSALGAFLWFWKNKKRPEETRAIIAPPIDAYEEAINSIESLEKQVPRPAPKPFVFSLSEILRLYVERRFKINALEKTGDEFLHEVMLHPFLRDEFEQTLRKFISLGDQVKYSSHSFGDQETNALLRSAREFIKNAESKSKDQYPQNDPAKKESN
jgi:hypothetical protein